MVYVRLNKIKIVDYFFWILFILFSNPGGIQQALNIYEFGIGGINLNDYLFVIMLALNLAIPISRKRLNKNYLRLGRLLLLFLAYYIIIFSYLTPLIKDTDNQGFFFNMMKGRWALYSIFLFFFTYLKTIKRGLYFL